MLAPETLADQIARVFATKLHVEVPSVDTDLVETGVLDSMAFVELLLSLEEGFGVKVSLDELELDNFRSIARIAEFVAGRDGAGVTPGQAAAPGR
jgi:acyl carrier protein